MQMILDTERWCGDFAVQTINESEVHESGKISITTKEVKPRVRATITEDVQVHRDIALRLRFDEGEPIF